MSASVPARDGGQRAAPWVHAVTVAEVERQRSLGWPDWHPEDFCHGCGRRNVTWHADNDAWDQAFPEAVGTDGGGIWCPSCFVAKWEAATGLRIIWDLTPSAASGDLVRLRAWIDATADRPGRTGSEP